MDHTRGHEGVVTGAGRFRRADRPISVIKSQRREGTHRMMTAATLAIIMSPATATAILMGAQESLRVAIPYLLCILLLSWHESRATREWSRTALRCAVTVLLAGGVVTVLVRILIIPHELYELWFRTQGDLQSSIAISRIFVMTVTVASAAIATSIYRSGVRSALAATGLLALLMTGIARAELELLLAGIPAAFLTVLLYQPRRGRAGRQALAVLLAAALALPWLVVEEPGGNALIDGVVSPWLRSTLIRRFPRLGLDLGFGMFNTQFDTRNLAGRAALSERQVLEIEGRAGELLYLRTGVFDVYTGNSWDRSTRMEQAGLVPERGITRDFPPRGNLVRITFLTELFEAVPHTLVTRHVDFPDRRERLAMAGQRDAGFRFRVPPPRGETIILHEGLREAALSMRNTGSYLQLPTDLPSSVRERASDIAEEAGADAARSVDLILEFLSRGFRYTLETDPSAYGPDFVESFLFETREGYCVHFATSFVVLARLLGIPTRYVTGFLVSMPDTDDEQPGEHATVRRRVSGLSAHAWPEIWIPNRGWTIVEPTPPMRAGSFADWVSGSAGEPDGLTERQLAELGIETSDTLDERSNGTAVDTAPGPAPSSAPATDTPDGPVLRRLGAALGLIVLLSAFGLAAMALIDARRRLRARRLPQTAYADWCLGELIRASAGLGVATPARSGYAEWGAAVADRLPAHGSCVRRTVSDAQLLVYGGKPPGPASCRRMLLLARRCRRERRRAMRHRVYGAVFPGAS
ncbi:MAG: transglutaminase domain-containing protein [Spirochaetaceae bacterium]|nr:MAG: transglutaminase domain-containing protein [Spirochaetaceae bacterium]